MKPLIALLALVVRSSWAAIIVRLNESVGSASEGLNGVHFSPLNHQLYFVYSQLVYDESFEQSLSPGLPEGDETSMGWIALSGDARWVNASLDCADDCAFNGNVSARLSALRARYQNAFRFIHGSC